MCVRHLLFNVCGELKKRTVGNTDIESFHFSGQNLYSSRMSKLVYSVMAISDMYFGGFYSSCLLVKMTVDDDDFMLHFSFFSLLTESCSLHQ